MILVTGGAGFIGSNFVLDWLAAEGEGVVNLDKLTYAGNLANLAGVAADPRHVFVRGDIGDRALVSRLLAEHKPRAVVHFAHHLFALRGAYFHEEIMPSAFQHFFVHQDALLFSCPGNFQMPVQSKPVEAVVNPSLSAARPVPL